MSDTIHVYQVASCITKLDYKSNCFYRCTETKNVQRYVGIVYRKPLFIQFLFLVLLVLFSF